MISLTEDVNDEAIGPEPAASRWHVLRNRLGLPDTTGSRSFVVAMLIDACGTGFFLPFSLVFFAVVGDFSLALIGIALTAGRLVSVPVGFLAGMVVDRVGIRPVAVISMVLRGLVYALYLVVSGPPQFIAVVVLAASCDKLYWAAHPVIVAIVADESERDRWFGLVDSIRNFGIGFGAVASGVLVSVGSESALSFVVAANSLSFLGAAAALSRQRLARPTEARKRSRRPAWRGLIRDRELLLLTLAKTQFCVGLLAIPVITPLYILESLDGPAWFPSTLLVLNCLKVVLVQGVTVAITETRARTWTMGASGLLSGVSCILFLVMSYRPQTLIYTAIAIMAMVIFTSGELTVGPASDSLALSLAPSHQQGTYLAAYNLSWSIAHVTVPLLATFLLSESVELLWSVLFLNSVAASFLVAVLHRFERVRLANSKLMTRP